MTSQPTSGNTNNVQPLPEWQPYPEDFAFNDDMFDDDSDELRKLKWIIDNKLSIGDKEIFLLYTHNDSNYRKTARILGCSPTTLRNKIIQIRTKILYEYTSNN